MITARVTTIGSYNTAPAFAYEIVEDGTLLASDVVVVHAKPTETWDDLAGLVRDFLERRAVVWFLATPEERAAEPESRLGGTALREAAPRVRGEAPVARHLVSARVDAVPEAVR